MFSESCSNFIVQLFLKKSVLALFFSNFMIDQFDAMTIGMNYNMAFPFAADLNNDGVINVLDLELLAKNYRKTGPVAWQ